MADYSEYMQPLSADCVPPVELEYRSAASELFVPDSSFIKARLAIHACENRLNVPGENVVDLIVHASQVEWSKQNYSLNKATVVGVC